MWGDHVSRVKCQESRVRYARHGETLNIPARYRNPYSVSGVDDGPLVPPNPSIQKSQKPEDSFFDWMLGAPDTGGERAY